MVDISTSIVNGIYVYMVYHGISWYIYSKAHQKQWFMVGISMVINQLRLTKINCIFG